MKIFLIILAIKIVVVGSVMAFASVYAERIVEQAVGRATGLRISIGSVSVNLWKRRFTVKDLRVFNPPGFPDEAFVHFPRILVVVHARTLFQPVVRFQDINLNLASASLFRNSEGVLNVESAIEKGDCVAASVQESSVRAARSRRSIHIEHLSLTIGTLRYRDERLKPLDISVDAGIVDKEFRDVVDVRSLSQTVCREVVKQAVRQTLVKEVGRMTALDPGSTGAALAEKAGETAQKIGAKIKHLFRRD